MPKIRRVNKKSESLEVQLNPKMREDGYNAGIEGEWIRLENGEWKFVKKQIPQEGAVIEAQVHEEAVVVSEPKVV